MSYRKFLIFMSFCLFMQQATAQSFLDSSSTIASPTAGSMLFNEPPSCDPVTEKTIYTSPGGFSCVADEYSGGVGFSGEVWCYWKRSGSSYIGVRWQKSCRLSQPGATNWETFKQYAYFKVKVKKRLLHKGTGRRWSTYFDVSPEFNAAYTKYVTGLKNSASWEKNSLKNTVALTPCYWHKPSNKAICDKSRRVTPYPESQIKNMCPMEVVSNWKLGSKYYTRYLRCK